MNELNEVVHELNNVLTGILVSSGLLEQRLDADSPLRRYAAGIREGGESGREADSRIAGAFYVSQECAHDAPKEPLDTGGGECKSQGSVICVTRKGSLGCLQSIGLGPWNSQP